MLYYYCALPTSSSSGKVFLNDKLLMIRYENLSKYLGRIRTSKNFEFPLCILISQFSFPVFHIPIIIPHYLILTSHFLLMNFNFLTSHYLLPNFHLHIFIYHFPILISHFQDSTQFLTAVHRF